MKALSLPLWLELVAAIFVALFASNLATMAFFQLGGDQRFMLFSHSVQSERIASTVRLLVRAPDAMRRDLSAAISGPGFHLALGDAPLVKNDQPRAGAVEAAILQQLPGTIVRAHAETVAEQTAFQWPEPDEADLAGRPPGAKPRITDHGPSTPPDMLASIQLPDGKWINMQLGFGMHPPPIEHWPFIYAITSTLIALLLAAIFMGRRVAQPLQMLAEAARGLRRGNTGPPVPETGPAPVREAARAFNAMSERVSTTLKSQQAMMAAVAHDLRTPIAVLRVRAEFVADDETRTRLLDGIAEMQRMTEAILSAMRMDGSGEPARQVDMGALVESLCADMEELGRDVRFTGAPDTTCLCRATEIRRALGNLIDNAVRYGDRAEVSLDLKDGLVGIHVDDEGPGIPERDMARVFEPFARLEESRSVDTGGHGLGLAIARLIASGHGGEITLYNRKPRGLRATLTLPTS